MHKLRFKKKSRKTSVVQANSKVTFHVPGLSTLQFWRQKITRPWKTILSGFAGSLSFFVPLPSRAISHARGHCVPRVLLDGLQKKQRLLVVYRSRITHLGPLTVRKIVPCMVLQSQFTCTYGTLIIHFSAIPSLQTMCTWLKIASHANVLRGSSGMIAWRTRENVCVGG